MASHQITIKDIARTLGISPSTVSRALKDHPDISVETRRQVQQLANSVNYRPNALALSLRRQKSNTIGVVIPEMVHHFFSTVISGIDDIAFSRGYNTMICQTNEDPEREMRNIQALLDSRIDGLMISVSKNTIAAPHLQRLIDDGMPVVFFDRICEDVVTNKVIIDDFMGGSIATKHLISIGCRKIAHLCSPDTLIIGQQRKEGYITALQEAGIPVENRYIIQADSKEAVDENREQLIAIAPEIDGIFASNDITAIAAIQILTQNGYRVPDDIAVIGFGDGPIATITSPTLSTVEQKGFSIGEEAARMLINKIEEGPVPLEYETHIFTPLLRIRESTRKI
ncbi:MAG: LacI family DNA-binding transcriptional regulator [Marinilabiliaceae bacterium]|nr:LacI family DNA-binding transcriptional regulator [Marinilabiliaceae bacterium]